METKLNVYSSLAPLNVLCAVFGYSVCSFRLTEMKKVLHAYCWVSSILCFVLLLFYLSVKVCFLQKKFTYLHAGDIVCMVMGLSVMSRYQFKFIACKNTNRNILDNINHFDRCLESIGIKVPHAGNLIICIMSITVIGCANMSFIFMDIFTVISGTTLDSGSETVVISGLDKQIEGVCFIILIIFAGYGFPILYMNFYSVIFIIQQRVSLFRKALLKFDELSDRNVAWSDRVSISVVGGVERDNFLTETKYFYKQINTMHYCLFDAFKTAGDFYTTLIFMWACILILSYSEVFIADAIAKKYLPAVSFLLLIILHDISFICFCSRITSELRNINSTVIAFYYKTTLTNLRADIKNWIYRCGHEDKKLNCGYFDLDFSIISLLFNLIFLLVLTVLQK